MPKNKLKLPDRQARDAILMVRRNAKMARSTHAYVRGNTAKFYEWLEQADIQSLPQGPAIWICGHCHTGNLCPVANAKGRVEIKIRDLDQTVIGNPAHDLIRLGLSLSTAARGSSLPGMTTITKPSKKKTTPNAWSKARAICRRIWAERMRAANLQERSVILRKLLPQT